jgi:hypothetical protein
MPSSKRPTEANPLVSAAEAFAETLQRFTAVAQAVKRAPLGSGEGLARAAEALRKVADCEDELQASAQLLIAALADARREQETQAEEVKARAAEIASRGQVYGALLGRFETIGRDAAELNATAQKLAGESRIDAGMTAEEISPVLVRLGEIDQRMAAVVQIAEALAGDARAVDFDDVHRKADALRQQLLAARNRMGLLREALTKAVSRTLSS